jgi:hypothetical protein
MLKGLRRIFRNKHGQATTEVTLMFPIFMIIFFITAKFFALLVIVQKLEIGSVYAARRWQLESHKRPQYQNFDYGALKGNIQAKVSDYIGMNNPVVKNFLGLQSVQVDVTRTAVFNIVTLRVTASASAGRLLCSGSCENWGRACEIGFDYLCGGGDVLEVVKYVPSRDRPIQYNLPGLQ